MDPLQQIQVPVLNFLVMNINLQTLFILSTLFVPNGSFSQDKIEDERMGLTLEFLMAFRKDILTNEQVMEKFVVEGNYFKNDSVRRVADRWMNDLRRDFKRPIEEGIRVLKYSEHADEFAVSDASPIGSPGSQLKMKFTLAISKNDKRKVPIDDLYAIEFTFYSGFKKEVGSVFVLYNNENKIISFAGMTIADHTSLVQF